MVEPDPRIPRSVREAVFAAAGGCCEDMGITPIGRATVARLHLNRSGVVNLRKSLRRLGLHPPPDRETNKEL